MFGSTPFSRSCLTVTYRGRGSEEGERESGLYIGEEGEEWKEGEEGEKGGEGQEKERAKRHTQDSVL